MCTFSQRKAIRVVGGGERGGGAGHGMVREDQDIWQGRKGG